MGIDFIEKRSRRSSGSGGAGGGITAINTSNGIMANSSGRIINGDYRHHQQQQQQQLHHNHSHNHITHNNNNNGYHSHNHNTSKVSLSAAVGSATKENGHYNQSGTTSTASAAATRTYVTSPSPSSAVNHTRSFLSYTSSPTLNGVSSRAAPNYNNNRMSLPVTSTSSSSAAVHTAPASTSGANSVATGNSSSSANSTTQNTTTPAKPSRTLSVRNFSNFVKRLPSLSLSPSVRIASSLGFSSTNSHNNHTNNQNTTSNGNNPSLSSSSSGPQSLTSGGNTATLKRPTTVSFQKKKARPFSYAEPGSLSNGHASNNHSHHHQNSHLQQNYANGISKVKHGGMGINNGDINPIPITNLTPKGRLENVGNDGPTYNGHNVADLEARLVRLRVQQRERRKSLDFAISCVEPDPTCFSMEEQV